MGFEIGFSLVRREGADVGVAVLVLRGTVDVGSDCEVIGTAEGHGASEKSDDAEDCDDDVLIAAAGADLVDQLEVSVRLWLPLFHYKHYNPDRNKFIILRYLNESIPVCMLCFQGSVE